MTPKRERKIAGCMVVEKDKVGAEKTKVLKHYLEKPDLGVVLYWIGPDDPLGASNPPKATGAYPRGGKILESLKSELEQNGYRVDILSLDSANRILLYAKLTQSMRSLKASLNPSPVFTKGIYHVGT